VNRNARSFLSCGRLHGFGDFLGFGDSLRQALGRNAMDFLITGLASAGLFIYLLYALLKPERF